MTMALMVLGLALAGWPAWADPARYDIAARIGPDGQLSARVTIDLPAEEAGKRNEFLLGERFTVREVKAGRGATVAYEPTDKPIAGLRKIVITYPERPTRPLKLRFRYDGPMNQGKDDAAPAIAPGAVELRLESFWVPTRSDISLVYAVHADIRGLPDDLVVVTQGEVRRAAGRLRIRRDLPDVDTPLVAIAGLRDTATPGMEFYGPANDPMVETFRTHAVASAKFLQDWLGPIPNGPTRIAVIPRVGGSSYARRGYIVISRPTPGDLDKTGDVAHARHVAHEFAHAWFLAADPTTEHYWLVESLAEYCAVRYAQVAFGPAGREVLIEAKRERAKTAGPILGGRRATRAALYQKAPLLLFALEARIGRPAMDRIIVDLAKRPPRTTPEFLAVLRAVAGEDEARRFEAELRAP